MPLLTECARFLQKHPITTPVAFFIYSTISITVPKKDPEPLCRTREDTNTPPPTGMQIGGGVYLLAPVMPRDTCLNTMTPIAPNHHLSNYDIRATALISPTALRKSNTGAPKIPPFVTSFTRSFCNIFHSINNIDCRRGGVGSNQASF